MSGLALSCYESTLCCFFNTTSLVSRKFWCLSVNLVQNDLKVFVAVRGKETKREREKVGRLSQRFICLAWVYSLPFLISAFRSLSLVKFFFLNYLQITAETNQTNKHVIVWSICG